MEIVILVGTGVIAVFFWVLLLLIFCNMRRVSTSPPAEPLSSSSWGLSPTWQSIKIRNKVGSWLSWKPHLLGSLPEPSILGSYVTRGCLGGWLSPP